MNEALSVLDALALGVVKASQGAPPASPREGESFRVTAPAIQGWAGREDHVAVLIGGAWHFVAPHTGMRLFDQGAGHQLVYLAQWQQANTPAPLAGGSVVAVQARAAIQALVQALQATGVLAGPAQ